MWRIAGRSSRRDYWCIKQSSQPGRRRIFRLKSARSKQRIGAKRAQGGKIHRIQSSGVWLRINGSIICAQFSEKRLVDVVEGRLLRPLPIISSSSSFFIQWGYLLRERERVGKRFIKNVPSAPTKDASCYTTGSSGDKKRSQTRESQVGPHQGPSYLRSARNFDPPSSQFLRLTGSGTSSKSVFQEIRAPEAPCRLNVQQPALLLR